MSEMAKTGLFIGVAVLALFAAVMSRPTPPPVGTEGLAASKNLNPIDDPLAAQEMEIIRWDQAKADAIKFQVARVDGVWKIPSHGEYPADADRQMGDAATAATNLKPLGIASTKNADHEVYGVIDPETAKPGTSGVGTRLVMKNGKGETLVSTIIGKEVKGQAGQRYVRQVGKDPVYIVKIDPSKLSTKFEDWIEKDLLKLNTLDIAQVKINDYSVKLAQTQGGLGLVDNRRGEIELAYDDAKSVWSVLKLLKWDEETREMVPDEMPAGEEINNTKLNEMKSALADLKIIDVQRKPAGMSADLKAAQDFVSNQQAIQNLMQRGFYPVRGEGESIDILSSEGDFIVEQKDGVEYVLRFGGIKLGGDGAAEEEKPADETAKKPEDAAQGENRYLFVAARFNPNALTKPEKPAILGDEPATEEPAGEKADPAGETEAAPSTEESPKDETPKAETPKDEAPKDDAAAPADGEKPAEKAPAEEAKEEKAPAAAADENAALTLDEQDGAAVGEAPNDVPPASEEATPPKANPATETAKEKEAIDPAGKEKEPAPATEEGKSEPAKEAPATEAPAVKPDDAAAKREAAEMQYNRAMDEYNEKVEKAQARVTELNDRFGDWYYVISDDVFKKIHITRTDLFVKKAAEKKEGEAAPSEEAQPTSIPLDAPESIKQE